MLTNESKHIWFNQRERKQSIEGGIEMSSKNGINGEKEVVTEEGTKPLLTLLQENKVTINGKTISQEEKKYINNIMEEIFAMDWKQEDERIKMMFELSLIIDEIHNFSILS